MFYTEFMEENYSPHLIIITLLAFIALNLLFLDIKVFSPESMVKVSEIASVISPLPSQYKFSNSDLYCPAGCINLIKEASSANKLNIGSPSDSQVNSSNTNQPFAEAQGKQPTTNNSQLTTSHEYYIPLGSGTTSKSDWEDLVATETIIDPSNYGSIKEAYFVASLRNPTQNGIVEAQVYNVTDKHPVWGSHVVMNGPASQTINSDKISLDSGTKLYRVQLKSSLQFQVYLDNAKIRIITD